MRVSCPAPMVQCIVDVTRFVIAATAPMTYKLVCFSSFAPCGTRAQPPSVKFSAPRCAFHPDRPASGQLGSLGLGADI